MTRAQRLVPLALAVVIAVIAVVVLTAGGGDDEQQAASTPTRSGTPTPAGDHSSAAGKAQPATPKPKPKPPLLVQGSPRTLRFTEGERIRFRVRARQADEVHVHGYDRLKEIAAGQTVTFSFPASITGIFEVELEGAGEQLGSLRVDPR